MKNLGFDGHNWGTCKKCGKFHDANERNRKISEAHIRKTLSLKHRKKLSKAHIGQIPWNKGLTKDDQRVARSLRNFGHKKGEPYKGKLTKEGREKLRENGRRTKGCRHTEETKQKMRKAHLGKKQPMSEKGRQNISKNHYSGFTGIQWQNWVKQHPECLGKISMPQKRLFLSIKEIFPNAKLEYPFRCNDETKFLDIYIPSLKINIEYDGMYWHDVAKDAKRDELLKHAGIIIIRLNKNTYMDVVTNPKIIFQEVKYI